nr:MAG TPA: hypothetical protein [Caudoviricetes sp.]
MAEFNRAKENWCPNCQTAKENKYFIQSLSPVHDGFLPLCRACLTARFKTYKSILNSDGGALWCVCSEMSYPVIKKYYDMALEKSFTDTRNLFMIYHSILKDEGFQINGFWQSDIMLDDIIELDTKTDEMAEDKEKAIDLAEQERIWGKFEEEDYELLNDLFARYTKDLFSLDTVVELRYRDLCKAELSKRKADESGDINAIAKAQENIKKMLELLKLNNFQSNTKTEVEKTLEYQIAMMEKYKPAELEDISVYEDYCGCHHLEEQLMRPLRNLIAGSREYPTVTKE